MEKIFIVIGGFVLLATCAATAPTFLALASTAFLASAVVAGLCVGSVVALLVVAAILILRSEEGDRKERRAVHELDVFNSQVAAEVALRNSDWRLPDMNGLYPAHVSQLTQAQAPAFLQLSHTHQLAQRTWPNVPNSFSYNYQPQSEHFGMLEDGLAEQPFTMPTFTEILDAGHISFNAMMFGYGPDGGNAGVPHKDLGSSLMVGRSGAGKTNFGRWLAAQCLIQKATIYIADPEAGTPDDLESESLADALAGLPVAGVASTAAEINSLCTYIAKEAQIQGRNKNERLILFVDEANRLLRNSSTGQMLTEAIYQTGAAGRKRGVFCWCFGQAAGTKHVDTEIRDLFTSFIGFAGSQDLFGDAVRKDERDMMASLPKYHVLYMPRLGGEPIAAAVPFVSNQDLEIFRTGDDAYAVTEPLQLNVQNNAPGNVPSSGGTFGDAQAQDIARDIAQDIEQDIDPMLRARIIQALKSGMQKTQIVRDVCGVRGNGDNYAEACVMVESVIVLAFLDGLTEEKYSALDELGLMLLGALQDGQTINDVAETFGRKPSPKYREALENIYATIRKVIQ